MICKAVIVVLTLGAVGVGLNSVPSSRGQYWEIATWGTTSGEPRFHLRMQRWCVVLESWTLHDPAGYGRRLPKNNYYGNHMGIAGFYYREGDINVVKVSQGASSESWYRRRGLWCPGWFITVLLATYPTIAFIRQLHRHRRRKRRKRGECVECGYNLTGNVTGVCSECGVTTDHEHA